MIFQKTGKYVQIPNFLTLDSSCIVMDQRTWIWKPRKPPIGGPPFMEIVQDFPAKVRMFPINGYPSD